MKSLKIVVATALVSTSFITTPSFATTAATASPPTTADMQAVCNAEDTDGLGTAYQVILTEGSVDAGTPTNDLSTVKDDETTRVADHSSLSSPYGTMQYYGNAGRHGGSVNLFATTGYPGITYAGSFVDQYVDRTQTDTYNFSCQLQHYQVVGSHDETVPGTPPQGYYTNNGTLPSGSQGSCQGLSPANPHWGEDIGNCTWHQTAAGTEDSTVQVPDYGYADVGSPTSHSIVDGPYYVDTVLYQAQASEPTVSVTETGAAPYFAGDGAVCINPGKKGGTWSAKAGWTHPEQCNTTYFNTAPYISGANVFSSNSLPN